MIADPDEPGNWILHLTATGPAEDKLNHAETTFVNNRAIVDGREYEISFKAKWIGGSNQVNTRLYFNRLPKTTLIDVPLQNGTPGLPNSTLQTNVGPTYNELTHTPVIPNAGESVRVSVIADDPDGVAGLSLVYLVNGQNPVAVGMVDTGGGRFEGTIPGQAAASIVQFYAEGTDSLGGVSDFPAEGPQSRALYKVQDNQAATLQAHNFRIIMTPADTALLLTTTNLLSNDRIGATVVYKESEVFYDVGVRLKGSLAGRARDGPDYVSFNVKFDPMQLFRGVHDSVAIDRSGRGSAVPIGQDEILVKHMMNHAGGIHGMYDDLVYLISPNPLYNRPAQLMMARYGDEFLDSQFEGGSDGTVFKLDILYVPTTTVDGNPESLKKPAPATHPAPKDLTNYGDDKEAYRNYLLIRNNRMEDDYSKIIALSQAMSLSGTALAEAIEPLMDYDEWARLLAMQSLVDCLDTYYRSGYHHNISFYAPPDDGKVEALFWDWDLGIFGNAAAPLTGSYSTFAKVVNLPGNRRVFHGHLLDLINTTFKTSYMDRWIDHYGDVVGQNFSPVSNYITARRNFVLANLPASIPFAITTNSGADFTSEEAAATLAGNGWINVREIRLQGEIEPLEVVWTDNQTWEVTLQLDSGPKSFVLEAVDFQGNVVGTDTITITGPVDPLKESLRITELNYNPHGPTQAEIDAGLLDNDDFEFIELKNVGPQTIDLAGVQFADGIYYTFPATGGGGGDPLVVITEAGVGTPDALELQNVSDVSVDTSGWTVVSNNGRFNVIDSVHTPLWSMPDLVEPGDVVYRPDTSGDNIFWYANQNGWIMLLDAADQIVDFVIWGYSDAEIATMDITANGFSGNPAAIAWTGPSAAVPNATFNALSRQGNSDHNDASDWTPDAAGTLDEQNVGLIVPFEAGTGIGFALAPGQFVVLGNNAAALEQRYGSGLDVTGEYTGRLDNGGERILLLGPQGQAIQDFVYEDSNVSGWPDRADGNGASLELIEPTDVPQDNTQRTVYLEDGDHWRSSSEYLGTPGSQGNGPYQGVVVNEVLTNTPNLPLPPGEGWGEGSLVDAIELYNPTDTDVALDGWWLSDDNDDFFKFQIPAGTSIPAYGYVTFYEGHYEDQTLIVDQQTEFGGTGPKDFALNGPRGDDVWLLMDPGGGSSLQFADHVEFGSALPGESFGRWPDESGGLYPMTRFTPDDANSGPRPPQELVISELMYNPPGNDVPDELEFIEIYNTAPYPVNLTGWRLRKGFDYDFAPGTVLDAYQALVIVSFDPSDATKLNALRSEYGIGLETLILGNRNDNLSDLGERIQLQRPDTPPPDDPLYVPHVIEDEVDYLNTWRPNTDGLGESLNRSSRLAWGNDSASWSAESPTPGDVPLLGTDDVAGRYVFYNNSAYDNETKGLGDADAIAADKTPLRPGQQAGFANYTNYVRGINGIVIDVFGLANSGAIGPTDFTFKLGNDDTPAGWSDAPTPSIDVVSGPGDSDRILLSWDDNAITNTWLEVSILVTANTGLAAADVFYFGNLVGESTGDGKVDAYDVLETRNNPRPFFNPALLDTIHDFNRDRRVDAIDTLIARNNQTWSATELQLLDLSGAEAAPVEAKSKTTRGADLRVHEAALEQLVGRISSDQRGTAGKTSWLYEFEQESPRKQRSRATDPVVSAVDQLRADDRP